VRSDFVQAPERVVLGVAYRSRAFYIVKSIASMDPVRVLALAVQQVQRDLVGGDDLPATHLAPRHAAVAGKPCRVGRRCGAGDAPRGSRRWARSARAMKGERSGPCLLSELVAWAFRSEACLVVSPCGEGFDWKLYRALRRAQNGISGKISSLSCGACGACGAFSLPLP
jgi:hypothetical protein